MSGYGYGYGDGDGDGDGYGYGYGYGDGYGYGYGDGSGYGYGYGYGDGDGYGDGYGYGDGSGYGSGYWETFAGAYTGQDCLFIQNAESQRKAIEVLGVDRFFESIEAQVLHQDVDGYGNPRRLVRVPLAQAEGGYLGAVHVVCPTTGRRYFLNVAPDVTTCQEAVASTFGMKPEQYKPGRET